MKRTPKTKRPASSPSPESGKNNDYAQGLESLTRYLALRDHSPHELRAKLGRRYDPELVERLLKEADEQGWLPPEAEIAERLAVSLARRHKSQMYIDGELRKRGLPPVTGTSEIENIRHLLERKFGSDPLTFEETNKAYRFLRYRGFKDSAIRQVLNEKREG